MNPRFQVCIVALLLLSRTLAIGKMTPEQMAKLPPPAAHQVDFSKEIKPILETSCTKCHGRGKSKCDLRIDTRATLLKGSENGPVIVPGKSQESLLIDLVTGFDPDNVIPKKGSKLNATQIGLLRAWIDQGPKWDSGVSFGKIPPINLKPVEPIVPAGPDAFMSRNAIDLILESYYAQHAVAPGEPVNDHIYARRV